MSIAVASSYSRGMAAQILRQQARIASLQATAAGRSPNSSSVGRALARAAAERTRSTVASTATRRMDKETAVLSQMRSTLQGMRDVLVAARSSRSAGASSTIDSLRRDLMAQSSTLSAYGVSVVFDGSTMSPSANPVDPTTDVSAVFLTSAGGTTTSTSSVDAAGLAGPSVGTAGVDARTPSTAGLSGTGDRKDGLAATAPTTSGLSGTSTDVAGVATAATGAVVQIGTFSTTGVQAADRIVLALSVGGVSANVAVALAGATTADALATRITSAIAASSLGSSVVATADTSGRLFLRSTATGANADVTLSSAIGLDGDGTVTSTLGMAAQAAKVTSNISAATQAIGVYSDVGRDSNDRLQLQIAYAIGSATLTTVDVTMSLAGVSSAATFATALQSAIDAATGSGKITVVNTSGAISLRTAASLGQNQIWLKSISGLDGNGTVTTSAGIASATGRGTDAVSTAARTTTGSDFSAPITVDENDEMSFDLTIDGSTTKVRVTKALVEAALSDESGRVAGTGTISTIAQFAKVVSRAVGAAGVSGVTVAAAGSRLVLSKTAAGVGSISISNVAATSTPTTATLSTGSDFAGPTTLSDGATIGFDLSVDGRSPVRVVLDKAGVDRALAADATYVAGSGTISTVAQMAAVVRDALSGTGTTAVASGARILLSRTTAGPGSIAISGVSATPSAARAASALTGSDFAATTIGADDTLRLTLMIDGATKDVSIDRVMVDAALASKAGYVRGSGSISDASALASVVDAGLRAVGASGIAVAAEGQRLRFSKTSPGAGSLSVWNGRKSTTTTVTAPSGVSLARIDLRTADAMASDGDRTAAIDAWIAGIDGAMAGLEEGRSRIAFQEARANVVETFSRSVGQALSGRATARIDVDMDREQAKLAAIHARQALLRTLMPIANGR